MAALLGAVLTMRREMRGMALIELLVGLSVIAAVLGAALPLGLSLYQRAAVEYEAIYLIAELRRVQVVSRTTAMPLYMLEQGRKGAREPRLYMRADGYDIHHPAAGVIRAHDMLPLVRLRRYGAPQRPAAFDYNGNIAWERSGNMTIHIYAIGYEDVRVRVVIDRAARIRLERGAP